MPQLADTNMNTTLKTGAVAAALVAFASCSSRSGAHEYDPYDSIKPA